MTDYSKMSDQQINEAVAIAKGTLLRKGEHVSLYQIDGLDLCTDFCNSWADAGPIILANRIGLTPSVDIWHAYSADEDFLCSISNPLRAAMIVFLMMKESENDS